MIVIALIPTSASPSPQAKDNLLVPLFRVLSHAYSARSNAVLGENTYLHSDWWTFGSGTVPAMLKIDPRSVTALNGISPGSLKSNVRWERELEDLVQNSLNDSSRFAVEMVGFSIMSSVLGSAALPGGSNEVAMSEIAKKLADRVTDFRTLQDRISQDALGSSQREFQSFQRAASDDIKRHMRQDSHLREVAGPLIYAGSIEVGDLYAPPLLIAGMLVSERDLIVHTQTFVGTLTSLQGNITAQNLYYSPTFG